MSIKAKPTFSLKDQLFNKESVRELSDGIRSAFAAFPQKRFEQKVLARFPALELKQRIDWIVSSLEPFLPDDFDCAREILLQALPAPLDPDRTDDDFGKFIWIVPGEYVAKHGCTRESLAASLDFLREATKRFSSEGAIRPFLQQFADETIAFVRECAVDDNYHVRRLASEGIRPFLPWAPRARIPNETIVGVLDQLHADPTRYVTRSVANTLNDIARIDADLVVETLKRWNKQRRQNERELAWMSRHALRTLLKDDHAAALRLLGYSTKPQFRLSKLSTTETVTVGEAFEWRCSLRSLATQQLKITLRIHFLKANGSHSPKVFAVKDGRFGKGDELEIQKRLSFKPITTRVLYPGTHRAELLVNGVSRKTVAFELTV